MRAQVFFLVISTALAAPIRAVAEPPPDPDMGDPALVNEPVPMRIDVPPRGDASPANGRILIGLERAFGVAYASSSDDQQAGGERYYPKAAADGIVPWSLGRIPASFASHAPRLAADWVEGSTTLGISATVWAASLSRAGAGAIQNLDANVTIVAVAPRLGWLFCDRERLCFWAKAGVTLAYSHAIEHVTGPPSGTPPSVSPRVDDSLVALNAEPTLLLGLTPHLALAAAGAIDVPIVSSRQITDGNVTPSDPSPWNLGASLGLLAWF